MHEVNISALLSITRLFLTQQLIYQSKIEKHNVSLDIFVSDTSLVGNLQMPKLEKKYFSYIRTYTLFFDQISIFVLLKIKECLRIKALL